MSQETKQPVYAQVPAPEHSAQQTPATTAAASSAPSSAQPGAAPAPQASEKSPAAAPGAAAAGAAAACASASAAGAPGAAAGPEPKLKHLPVNMYAIVMGLAGFSLTCHAVIGNATLDLITGLLASAVFVVLTILYGIKIIKYPGAVVQEASHPVKLSFFPAFSISLLLLSSVWLKYDFARYLWLAGCTLQLFLTLFVLYSLVHKSFNINHVNPAWFIPVAGPLIVPLAGIQMGYGFISSIAYPVGFLFWILLFTILLYRLVFHDPLPPKLVPMLCIMLAPPSVAALSYHAIDGFYAFPEAAPSPVVLMLYGIAWFVFVFLLTNIRRFMKAPFFLSAWAYSFPVAAFILATRKLVPEFADPAYKGVLEIIDYTLWGLFTMLILWLAVRTVGLIAKGKICVPE